MDTANCTQAEIARCVDRVLQSRRSTRAYRPDPLPAETVLEILDAAATAPSNSNTQPWRVHVLAGAALRELGDALVASFREGSLPPSPHFPDPLPPEFGERQADFATRYYGCLGIDRHDADARSGQTEKNFHFFGAPVGLLFSIDRRLTAHSWLDVGLFVQNVMIAAGARGIATCPQVSFARFHPVIASRLGMSPDHLTACGMSMGFAETAAAVNQVRMPRQGAREFAQFVGFEPAPPARAATVLSPQTVSDPHVDSPRAAK
ncbi:nitroreductase [Variovorax sp. J22P271]|uniref:nitroreductase n=1 Tax=Variovorax davisae TaxID=3053515 RepID=UPI002574D105|nr:nitroreductase [Variovorax sp. J22P271]MDM0032496.1 nitroreductase [Variovorax sp. J22P271]